MNHQPLAAPILCLLALAACSPKASITQTADQKARRERPPLVRTQQVEVRKVRREIETTGFLESEHQVTLYSKVQGRVLEVPVDEGSRVKKGDVLARLDRREAEAAKRQTEVLLEDRRVRLELGKLDVETSGRRLEQAKNDRARAEAEFRRNKDIDPTLISPKVLQDAELAYLNAIEAVRVAEFGQKRAVLDVKAAENLIQELEAKVEDAKIKLAEHDIVAPLDGAVTVRKIKGGETIGLATELFVVTDLDNLVLVVSRPQRELPIVKNSKQVAFTADGLPGRTFTALVDLVSPVVDQLTGSFRIRMRVRPEDAQELRPGMFVRGRILTELDREALMVPKAAVLSDGELAVVFAVRNGFVRKITLDQGLEQKEWVESRARGDDGLLPNDLVVVSGHQDLRDQAAVEVQTASPAEAAAPAPASRNSMPAAAAGAGK